MTKQVQRRRGTASQHTSFTGAEGEISVNTTNKSVHVHDGVTAGGVEAARADLGNVSDADLNTALSGNTLASLTITSADINGGTIDGTTIGGVTPAAITGTTITGSSFVTTGDMTFGDSDKAIFGAGSDLQIYSDGTQSFIQENGPGALYIQGTHLNLNNAAGTSSYITAVDGGSVTLFSSGSPKLATTSTGVDVTGTITSDGLTVDGDGYFGKSATGATTFPLRVQNTSTDIAAGVGIEFSIDGVSDVIGATIRSDRTGSAYHQSAVTISTRRANGSGLLSGFKLDQNGDISFYEDTGTTPKFFWDASAESLGIGTSSPTRKLQVVGSTGDSALFGGINAGSGTANIGGIQLGSITDNTERRIWGLKSESTTLGTLGIWVSSDNASSAFSGSQVVSIKSNGNVGIGTSSPSKKLHVQQAPSGGAPTSLAHAVIENNGETGLNILTPSTSTGWVTFGDNSNASIGRVGYSHADNALLMYTAATERMRIDSSGNLLVGTTDIDPSNDTSGTGGIALGAASYISLARANATPLLVNRIGTDGANIIIKKNGTTVGSIGVVDGDIPYFTASEGTSGLKFDGDNSRIAPCNASGAILDNTTDLGASGGRFDDIYATNGTIQTSDRNEKQDIDVLSDAETRVAVACKGLLRKFRWKDAVAEKGDDARIHFGIIAQDLQAAFEAEGLDAGRYAMFIHTTWTDEETGEEKSRMGVRYSELLAFIIAAI
jgi:hypothetical protein